MVWSLHGTATMRHAVEDWLEHGLSSREKATRDANRHLCEKAVRRAIARDKVRRNVVELTEVCPPPCQAARSKAMSARSPCRKPTGHRTRSLGNVCRKLNPPRDWESAAGVYL
jgi:hypothetical protein